MSQVPGVPSERFLTTNFYDALDRVTQRDLLDGRLALGTWQSICLVDLNVDNDRREVRWSFLEG